MQAKLEASLRPSLCWSPPTDRNWNPDDGLAMLAALRASNESIAAFLRRYGITVQRYHYWRTKLEKPQLTPSEPLPFREVRLVQERHSGEFSAPIAGDRPVTIRAGKFRFLVHADTDPQALDTILRSISMAEDAKA